MSKTLLLSDLHLSKNTSNFNFVFKTKIPEWKSEYDALYLLGDIFDAWLGDDILEDYALEIIESLKNFSEHKELYFMHGNRDFLIGEEFLQKSGAILLHDPSLVRIYQKYYILSHGDLLCTDDIKYQNFRTKTRTQQWKNNILKKPKYYRKMLAKSIRTFSSIRGKSKYQQNISDATVLGIQQLKSNFNDTPNADIIHGHTHKPKIHSELFDLKKNYVFNRYVLPDWRPNVHGGLCVNDQNELSYIYF